MAYMLMSAEMLLRLGIPYDAPFGPPLAKFHPGTYLLLLAWFVALASHGNPLRIFGAQLLRHGLLSCYFISMVCVFAWVLFRHGISGTAFIVESLWTPAIAAYVLYLLDHDRRRQIVTVVMLVLTANAVLAIGEVLLHMRLTPLRLQLIGAVEEDYFRASAFLGHPLHNALITVALFPAISLLPWSLSRRLLAGLLLALSVLAFGGRASLVLSTLAYGGYASAKIMADIFRGRLSYLQLTGGSLALVLGMTVLIGVIAVTGLGDRIFDNLQMDSSANVRLRAWDTFNYLSATDWWIGISPAEIDHIAIRMGLDLKYEAIENFWIYLFIQFGLIGFIPFLLAIGCLTLLLWKEASPAMRVAIPVYFMVASTANTLASKTISLMLLVVVILAGASYRRVAAAQTPPVSRDWHHAHEAMLRRTR